MAPQIDPFLQVLVDLKGSDLHIKCNEPPRVRQNGTMLELNYEALRPEWVAGFVNEIMTDEKRASLARDLDADFAYAAEGIGRFRVNVYTQRSGLAAVFRIIPATVPTVEDLKIPQTIRNLAMLRKGLVLVTGATGSGKSTTLAALVNLINHTRPSHILTIEDPIEFEHSSAKALVNQREIGTHATSFARALRAALREDPDVILVGEMRDVETISLAVTAAETGHLVLGTLHTNTASKAIDRIIDSFPPEQQAQIRVQLSETLRAVVAQQLVPRRDGNGRIAAYETLIGTHAVANLIRKGDTPQIANLMGTMRKDGAQTMDSALLDLAKNELVAPEEALAHSFDRKALAAQLKGAGFNVEA